MENESNLQSPACAVKTNPRIKIFGVGTAGIAITAQMASSPEFSAARFASVNADASATSPFDEQLHLETKVLRGLGTGGDPERGHKLAEEHFEKLKSSCADKDVVFILTGLGGGVGSGAAPVLARAARESGALVLAFVTLPFECEGSRRQQQAQQAMDHLQLACDGVLCLPNENTFKLLDENVGFVESFRASSRLLMDGVMGVWRLMMHRGLIEIHFEELCKFLRERKGECRFATVEAMGEDRVSELLQKVAAHPLLDGAKGLGESVSVLLSVLGGPDLSMKDVNRLADDVKACAKDARITMGVAVDETFQGKLAVTIIAASPLRTGVVQEAPEVPVTPTPAEVMAGSCDELLPGALTMPARATVAPTVPALNLEQREEVISKRTGKAVRARKVGEPRMRQITLPLDIISKGRFDKSEPTIHKGEDLDLPTYVRRGVALN